VSNLLPSAGELPDTREGETTLGRKVRRKSEEFVADPLCLGEQNLRSNLFEL
jgi:hypothetical protein